MTTFPHTILLNIQINQQIVCQKQKHGKIWFQGARYAVICEWHKYCTSTLNTATNYLCKQAR